MLLVGCMLFVALIENSFIVGLLLKRNPFPLVLTCLREVELLHFSQEVQQQIFQSIWHYVKN